MLQIDRFLDVWGHDEEPMVAQQANSSCLKQSHERRVNLCLTEQSLILDTDRFRNEFDGCLRDRKKPCGGCADSQRIFGMRV
ncbi:hypothetical protein RN69_38470 [Bradyrhizobium japonicum]|nr:hypothetical protein RN69_38470 [Bradyrhizobium japonicum]KMK00031.1 hypothetical protein CF64_05080 [Bradyrhizobium japonicum]